MVWCHAGAEYGTFSLPNVMLDIEWNLPGLGAVANQNWCLVLKGLCVLFQHGSLIILRHFILFTKAPLMFKK